MLVLEYVLFLGENTCNSDAGVDELVACGVSEGCGLF